MIRYGRRRPACPDRDGVCDFQVIGELRADPGRLLLLGDDGQFYAMDSRTGQVTPLEPDDSWAMDAPYGAVGRTAAHRTHLAS